MAQVTVGAVVTIAGVVAVAIPDLEVDTMIISVVDRCEVAAEVDRDQHPITPVRRWVIESTRRIVMAFLNVSIFLRRRKWFRRWPRW